MWLKKLSGNGAGGLISQWGSTIKLPWVWTVQGQVPILVWPYMLQGGKTPTNEHSASITEGCGCVIYDYLFQFNVRGMLVHDIAWSILIEYQLGVSAWYSMIHFDSLPTGFTCSGTLFDISWPIPIQLQRGVCALYNMIHSISMSEGCGYAIRHNTFCFNISGMWVCFIARSQ